MLLFLCGVLCGIFGTGMGMLPLLFHLRATQKQQAAQASKRFRYCRRPPTKKEPSDIDRLLSLIRS